MQTIPGEFFPRPILPLASDPPGTYYAGGVGGIDRQVAEMAKKRVGRKNVSSAPIKHTLTTKRMTREHPDVLQNIEFVLVDAHRADRTVDDCIVMETLRAALAGGKATDPRAVLMLDRLGDIRQVRCDVSEEIWRAGLSVIIESVRLHSFLRPGATGYLSFVSKYVK